MKIEDSNLKRRWRRRRSGRCGILNRSTALIFVIICVRFCEADPLEVDSGVAANKQQYGVVSLRVARNSTKMKTPSGSTADLKSAGLDEFLNTLPVLSVGQKHTATIECELDQGLDFFQLVWLKLRKANSENDAENNGNNQDESIPISINQKIISPDKRYTVRRQSKRKWILQIDKVSQEDDRAFYLCQASIFVPNPMRDNERTAEASANRFVGGVKLNVLLPPKIIEHETSPSLVQQNEFEPLALKCKVSSEPQAQVIWKREDGGPLENVEQIFKHQLERKPNKLVGSLDSSELIFASLNRQQAGAYLCIATNGVQHGVSQRVNLQVTNCRPGPGQHVEPCKQSETTNERQKLTTSTQEPTTSTEVSRKSWRTKQIGSPTATKTKQQQQQTRSDKKKNNGASIRGGSLSGSEGDPATSVSVSSASSLISLDKLSQRRHLISTSIAMALAAALTTLSSRLVRIGQHHYDPIH